MRNTPLAVIALLGLVASPALAQSQTAQPPPMQNPAMQAPAGGVRPGNVIGTRDSLPLSNRASNINRSDTASPIAPTLPLPNAERQTARGYLHAARDALAAGRTGQAQEALEMAETRALSRSVPPADARAPSNSAFIHQIGEARMALGRRDRNGALRIIDDVLGGVNQASSDGNNQVRPAGYTP